ncbi:DUF1684 domain-containing protein [Halostella pelagica]|uniref:DUF1684 domain-containing protein n=1 Tax=Halostella pelagica TaxID=2583824 RepID=UPI001081F4E6|nr:DUF1684 domain-containing protein [Halostella pelagica]
MTDAFDETAWRRELEIQREQKDEFFAEHRQSPVPPEQREAFDGLDYFDPEPDYRAEATVTVHNDPEPVTMDTTAGTEVRYLRELTLTVEIRGEQHDLAAYRQEGDEQYFVPFRDKTTGQQTYEGGRYMEFESEGELEDGDEIVLDFNLAYSPFCAYSETFACPLPPDENWLDVAVEAGEKAP